MATKVTEIQRELIQRIRVSIEWEGSSADESVAAAPSFTLEETLETAESTVERLEGEAPRYQRLLNALYSLRSEVTRLSSRVAEEILELGIEFESLRPEYFEALARQFERLHHPKCVLIVPEPWLPNLLDR